MAIDDDQETINKTRQGDRDTSIILQREIGESNTNIKILAAFNGNLGAAM